MLSLLQISRTASGAGLTAMPRRQHEDADPALDGVDVAVQNAIEAEVRVGLVVRQVHFEGLRPSLTVGLLHNDRTEYTAQGLCMQ